MTYSLAYRKAHREMITFSSLNCCQVKSSTLIGQPAPRAIRELRCFGNPVIVMSINGVWPERPTNFCIEFIGVANLAYVHLRVPGEEGKSESYIRRNWAKYMKDGRAVLEKYEYSDVDQGMVRWKEEIVRGTRELPCTNTTSRGFYRIDNADNTVYYSIADEGENDDEEEERMSNCCSCCVN